jgi:hypothetical protein
MRGAGIVVIWRFVENTNRSCGAGWLSSLKMFRKIYARKRTRRDWALLCTFAVIALGGIVVGHLNAPTGGATETASIFEHLKQDGTAAHPYADANQCPLNTDLVFWPNGHPIPSMPRSISVCFVGLVAQR